MTTALDTQIGGSHYTDMAIQPMEFSMANKLDACQHTIIKYVTRFRVKGGIQDLEKAKHVIDMLIGFENAGLEPGDPDFMMGNDIDESAIECQCELCRLDRVEIGEVEPWIAKIVDEQQTAQTAPTPDPIRELYDRLVKANAESTQERAFQEATDKVIAQLSPSKPSGAEITAAINVLLEAGVIRQVEDGDS